MIFDDSRSPLLYDNWVHPNLNGKCDALSTDPCFGADFNLVDIDMQMKQHVYLQDVVGMIVNLQTLSIWDGGVMGWKMF